MEFTKNILNKITKPTKIIATIISVIFLIFAVGLRHLNQNVLVGKIENLLSETQPS